MTLQNHFMVTHASGFYIYGAIEAASDDSGMYFANFNPDVAFTMLFGRVDPSTATLAWQKEATSTCPHGYCLVPVGIHLQGSSFVYFASSYTPNEFSSSLFAAVFKVSTDGSSIDILRGFGSTTSKTYLLAYYAEGSYAYFHGLSDKTEFQVYSVLDSYVVKALIDMDDSSCVSLGVIDLSVNITTGAAAIRNAASLTNMQSPSHALLPSEVLPPDV